MTDSIRPTDDLRSNGPSTRLRLEADHRYEHVTGSGRPIAVKRCNIFYVRNAAKTERLNLVDRHILNSGFQQLIDI